MGWEEREPLRKRMGGRGERACRLAFDDLDRLANDYMRRPVWMREQIIQFSCGKKTGAFVIWHDA